MSMKKIGIVSDTHGLLRPEVLEALQGCDAILHGGDINRQEILDRLEQIAPVYVVRGNNDKEWAEHLPAFLDFSLFGLRIFMTHKKKDLPKDLSKDLSGYDLVVYGHSHRYEERMQDGILFLNPGSCGPRRFNQEITLAVGETDEDTGGLRIRRIDIPHTPTVQKSAVKNAGKSAGKSAGKEDVLNLEKIQKFHIEKVIREIQKGRSVEEIAAGAGMEKDLAEQICRMYLTHPGVDAEGIMTKMGL